MHSPCPVSVYGVDLRGQVSPGVLGADVTPTDGDADGGLVDTGNQLHCGPDDLVEHQAAIVLGLRAPGEVARLPGELVVVYRGAGVGRRRLSSSGHVVFRCHDRAP
jgi:hypothetical protein